MTFTDEEIYKAAALKWGIIENVDALVEELGELIVAIQKWKRYGGEKRAVDIAGEVADVELMLGQLQYMMDMPIGLERSYKFHLGNARKSKRERILQKLSLQDISENSPQEEVE